ncbi:hypothetical protein ACFL4T_04615 [candidate division KSB1 bacterium]
MHLLLFSVLVLPCCGILIPETHVYKVYFIDDRKVEHYLSNEENFIYWDYPLEIEFNNYKRGGIYQGNVKFANLGWEKIKYNPDLNNGFSIYAGGRLWNDVIEIRFSNLKVDGNVLTGYYHVMHESGNINPDFIGFHFKAIEKD